MNRPRIPRRTHLAPVLWAMFAALSLVAPVGAIAAGRIGAIEQGYALGRLQAEELALERENQKLMLEVSTLRSPARLERIAKEQLHMAAPGSGDVLIEGGDSLPSTLGRAVAARR